MEFGSSVCIFINSANLICRSTDISKCFRGSLRLRDNENRLYTQILSAILPEMHTIEEYYFLKFIIRSQIILFSVLNELRTYLTSVFARLTSTQHRFVNITTIVVRVFTLTIGQQFLIHVPQFFGYRTT